MDMTIKSIAILSGILFAAIPTLAQQPQPKSPKERDALIKVQNDVQQNNVPQELKDIEYVLDNFADTQFKIQLLNMATDAANREGDYVQTVIWGDRTLAADPNNIPVRVTLAQAIAAHTRENDLDKDKSVKKVTDYANKAIDLCKAATTAPSGIPADQWPDFKKDFMAESHAALAQVAELNKNYPEAVDNYKTSIGEGSKPDPVTYARLSKAYVENKQYDDAIATADKVIAMSDATAPVKQFAQQQKDLATKLKTSK
jgi:tetratricopeptide (TPR) repeat protein